MPARHYLRRPRHLWFSRTLWRRRAVFWGGALATGLVSVVFALGADRAQALFHAVVDRAPWAPLILTPLGFMLCAHLARTVFPGSQGSGIPQAIAARHLRDREDRLSLLSLKIAFGKIVLTIVGVATGASIGREGPTVQIGSAIMLKAGELGGMGRARGLILAGSAAGVSAAFNTPLAGIVFAIEEMGRAFEARTSSLVISAVVISGLVSLGLVGNYSYFGKAAATVQGVDGWALVVICGLVGGAAGGLFSLLMLKGIFRAGAMIARMPLRTSLAIAGVTGLGVALLGLVTHGATFGTGYEQAKLALEGGTLPWYFAPAKLAATLLSAISGIPGGIFAPSLAVGTGVGSLIALLTGMNASMAALLGMAGYFAGVVQAPITAFVIILEMTSDTSDVIPVMVASMLGYGVSRLIAPHSLYHGLSRPMIATRLAARRAKEQAVGAAEG